MKPYIFPGVCCLVLFFSGLLFSQSIAVNSPGNNCCIGSDITIGWTATDVTDHYVEIYLKNEAGTLNVELISEHTDNDGEHTWTIPDHIAAGSYRIGIKTVDTHLTAVGPVFTIIRCRTIKRPKTAVLPAQPVTAVPVQKVRPLLPFVSPDHGEITLSPPRLSVTCGNTTRQLSSGGETVISVPEDSPLIDTQGRIAVTVACTLKNNTAKNFQFNLLLIFNNQVIVNESIKLLGDTSKTISKNVKLPATGTHKSIRLQGPVGISDDTHIIFFNARLWMRIYAL